MSSNNDAGTKETDLNYVVAVDQLKVGATPEEIESKMENLNELKESDTKYVAAVYQPQLG